MRAALILLFTLSAAPFSLAESKADLHCRSGEGSFRANIRGSSVVIRGGPLSDNLVRDEGQSYSCRATVRNPEGRRIFSAADWGMTLYESDKDINGDGESDLVFEAYSGGAHCCWTYWVVSLAEEPALLAYFENQRPAAFEDANGDGRIEIWTMDGAFDRFDDLSHAGTPFPAAVLQLEGRHFRDISSRFRSSYDKKISKARRQFKLPGLTEFGDASDPRHANYYIWKRAVLEIVFAYLYSGREHRAWKTLEKMWPAHDRARMKDLIWKTRSQGVLRYVARRKSSAPH